MAVDGWIKVHRKMLEWEWYDKSEMVHLFIDLLLNANTKEAVWRGKTIPIGGQITSLDSLSKRTKLSIQTIRTCLARFENNKQITQEATNKYRLITICKYDIYQERQARKQQASQQATNNKQEYSITISNEIDNTLTLAEFVSMTSKEYEKLKAEFGYQDATRMIEILNNYKGASGKKYKNDYRAILSWVVKRFNEDKSKIKNTSGNGKSKTTTEWHKTSFD